LQGPAHFSGDPDQASSEKTVEYPYGNNEIIITDDTLGIVIFEAEWDMDPDPRLYSFDNGSSWDSTHTYTLRMALWGSTNAVGFEEHEMGTNFPVHASVPEPATFACLLLGIIGLFSLGQVITDRRVIN
jgi:hypothetical protein